ncbi:MAG: MOSC domain-containing protein [Halochromatium sp.]|nr:MOSC domain-containing protein [Halochromatium sp.]
MILSKNSPLALLMQTFPRPGRLHWTGLRPAKRAALIQVEAAQAITGAGLKGDHYSGRSGSRGITLLQAEHLPVIAALTDVAEIAPATLRRNLLVSGINLAALKGQRFQIGEAVLEGTSFAHPCSRMEEVLGPGGYNALRGHGGLCARVIQGGQLRVGDAVVAEGADVIGSPDI